MRKRDPIDDGDIQGNLIEIRKYLAAHVRSSGQDNADPEADAPSSWQAYRHAEYSDGHRPRFATTDLILICLAIGLGGLLAVFLIY